VWHELTFGCRRLPPGRRRDALEAYLRDVVQASFTILPYDAAAAAWHGFERARLEALGRPAPYADGQIAAVAHANGLVLVTLNAAGFASFKGARGGKLVPARRAHLIKKWATYRYVRILL
jgi:tRNA(fMet)-specific endonuclease VapC